MHCARDTLFYLYRCICTAAADEPQVLQYLWLLNSHHEWVYKHMHGDKDTFLLAFAMAGKKKDWRIVSTVLTDWQVP